MTIIRKQNAKYYAQIINILIIAVQIITIKIHPVCPNALKAIISINLLILIKSIVYHPARN